MALNMTKKRSCTIAGVEKETESSKQRESEF